MHNFLPPFLMNHLKYEQRVELGILKREGYSQRKIANILGCHQSTISRELGRNSSPKVGRYTAQTAHQKAVQRREQSYVGRRWHENEDLLSTILDRLQNKRSPDQIIGRLKLDGYKDVPSVQSLYAYIKKDKYRGGRLYKYLRYQGKKYKWRGFPKDKTRIPNRKDISTRPEAVNQKIRYGDWESDLVLSCRTGKRAVATFVERKSLFLCAELVADKSAPEMTRATIEALAPFPECFRLTMTHDNGREIADHESITEVLSIDVYCARPYRSSDRGLNEWMNRELRRFFPKGTNFDLISKKELAEAVYWLNNCPRKSLGYRSPAEYLQMMHFTL